MTLSRCTFGLLAALVALVALAASLHYGMSPQMAVLFTMLAGTAVVTYTYPVTGTTPPTAAQMQNADTVRATVLMGDADTTATLTHNFAESTTALAQLFPDVIFYPVTLTSVSETSPPIVTVALLTNSITITKISAVGSGGLWNFKLARPNTLGN